MHPVAKSYTADFDFPLWVGPPNLTYMVATLPRSGSTFLSSLLWETGVLGAPLEYPNVPNQQALLAEYGGGDFLKYWQQMIERRTSPNGVFGFKMFTQFFHDVHAQGEGALEVIRADKVIRLKRREKVLHAISYSRALKTKKWFQSSKDHVEDEFDVEHIDYCLALIEEQERSWDTILRITEETSYTLYYEDLILDPAPVLSEIMEFLGISPPKLPVRDVFFPMIQHDPISQIWADSYTNYLKRRQADATHCQ